MIDDVKWFKMVTLEEVESMLVSFNVILTSEPPWYVAKCPDNNVASQGRSIEEALGNLKEALELYYEDGEEIPRPLPPAFLTTLEVALP